ncbi:transcription termination factor NusA [Candidatus Gracilibacteria bacterium]|nr:transcription termination factor NusA [Candidatus Gracilibacteria bacterium]
MLDLKKIEAAINQISAEKKIPKESLIEIIESAIKTAYKKDYGNKDEDVLVSFDLDAGTIEIIVRKTLVKEVQNPYTEISFEELGEDGDGYEEGDIIEIDMTDEVLEGSIGESFGRIASQAARQVIIQKIGDSEKQKIYDLFKDKVGEVISMKVVMVESGKVIFDYNGNQVILPKSEQVSRDSYTPEARFYLYVSEAFIDEKTGPKVVLSRKNKDIVGAIFKLNAPELSNNTITIDNIVRYPGVKTKILVSSEFEEIDRAGCLIGPKGVRVKTVMEELSGEKIDIIVNNGNIQEMISKSLTPAVIQKVVVNEEAESALVYLLPEERAKAIGKNGININLASNLIGYNISLEEIKE